MALRDSQGRVGLDYGEVVHQSRIFGEWSNMNGYGMGSSSIKVCIMLKDSPGGEF